MSELTSEEERPVYEWSKKVSRRCACRGEVIADPADARDVHESVVSHQLSVEHGAWADAAGFGRRTALTPPVAAVRRVA